MVIELAVVVAFGLAFAFRARSTPQSLRAEGEVFAAEYHAYVPSELVPAFDRLTRSRRRFVAFWAFAFWASWFLTRDLAEEDLGPQLGLAVCGLVLAVAIAWRTRSAGREFLAPDGARAVARAKRVRVGDYVGPQLVACAWINLLVAAGLVVAGWVDAPTFTGALAVVDAGVLLASLAFLQTAAIVICRRPQAAVDPSHLYLKDAWRASFLVQAFGVVAAAAGVLAILHFFLVADFAPAWGFQAAVVVGALQVGLFVNLKLRFRRRLWPTLAPRQVLYPGQDVPPREGAPA